MHDFFFSTYLDVTVERQLNKNLLKTIYTNSIFSELILHILTIKTNALNEK